MNSLEEKILQSVDRLTDDILNFTIRLVSEASVLGNEASAVDVFEKELQTFSLNPVRVPIDTAKIGGHPGFAPVPWDYAGKDNIVAARKPDGVGGKSALFNGHLDVVTPEPLGLWKRDPFQPYEEDGWLYGRGAGDMKSGLAAAVHAIKAIENAGLGLAAPVIVEGVLEEECTGNGALACLLDGHDADAVLIPEPFGPTILTSELGVLWFRITVFGVPKHVLEAPSGTNAIEKSYILISALRELEAEMNGTDVPEAYRKVEHPLNLNIGILKGGDWPSTVPAQAEMHCRFSYFPGDSYEPVCRKIMQTVRAAARKDPWLAENPPQVEFYGFRSDGHTVSRELPALKTLNDCHRTLWATDAQSYAATCTTDLRAFTQFGQGQATCYGPVAENIHGANERVELQSVMNTARVYALFLARWCGVVE